MLNELNHDELLKFISKKKDDEQKMMSIAGVTIGTIIILSMNIIFKLIDEIPSITTIYNWQEKFLIIFVVIFNAITTLFMIHHIIFPGNNEELSKNKEVYQSIKLKLKEMERKQGVDYTEKYNEFKNYMRDVKEKRNAIDRSLEFVFLINGLFLIVVLILNVCASIFLFRFSKFDFIINVFVLISLLLTNKFVRTKLYSIFTFISVVLSIGLIVLILFQVTYKSFTYNYLLIKYSILFNFIIYGLSSILLFITKLNTYMWLTNLEDKAFMKMISDEDIIYKLNEIYFKRINLGFFNRGTKAIDYKN